jgi:hypothetical protein
VVQGTEFVREAVMIWPTKLATAVIGLSCLMLGGCPGKTDNALSGEQTALFSDTTAGKGEGLTPPSTDHSRHSTNRRAPGRDVSTVVYSDPEYGIAFRYPRDYALEEGDIEERSYFLRRQEELEAGSTLLATVLIPEDAYPNTTFEHGSLQVVANERSSMAGTQIVERHYAGFAKGRCYEFFAVVAVGETDEDEAVRQGDVGKVLRQLEKILASVRLDEGESVPEQSSRAASEPRL